MASFPSTIKTFSGRTDYVNRISASDINELQDEASAIETALGWLTTGSLGTAGQTPTMNASATAPIWITPGPVNVKVYGAKGDGSTNDNTAVAAAVVAVADGGALYFPPGTYVLTATIAFSGKSVTIRGEGPRASILQFTGCNGITITHNADTQFSCIRDMALITGSAGTYVGITITGFDVSSSIQPHLLIDNVYLLPNNPATHYWAEGILLTEVWNGTIRSCFVRGNNTYSSATNGIRIDAETLDIHILDCKIYHYDTGIKIDDDTPGSQGVRIHQALLVEVNTGVDHNTPTNGGLGFEFIGGHIAAYNYGIRLAKVPQSIIQGVLIYKTGGANFVGIELTTSQNTRIAGAMVRGSGAGTEIGINLKTGSTSCSVVGCSINDQDTAILLDSGANINAIVGNSGTGNTAAITDNGTGNSAVGNTVA